MKKIASRLRSSGKKRRRALRSREYARDRSIGMRTLALLDTLGPPRTNSAILSARAHDSRVHAITKHPGRSLERHASSSPRCSSASRSCLQMLLQRQARISIKCIDVSRQPFYYPHAPIVTHVRARRVI